MDRAATFFIMVLHHVYIVFFGVVILDLRMVARKKRAMLAKGIDSIGKTSIEIHCRRIVATATAAIPRDVATIPWKGLAYG